MRHVLRIATAALLSLAGSTALAGTSPQTTTFKVTATVIKGCVVSAGDLALGNYDPAATSDLAPASASTIAVTCTKNTNITVAALTGSFKMHSATTTEDLTYKLYQDSLRTKDWSTTSWTAPSAGATTPVNFTVYGFVGKNQNVGAAADYTDTVTVTVTFS
jgi:spore coat protein U-like protein